MCCNRPTTKRPAVANSDPAGPPALQLTLGAILNLFDMTGKAVVVTGSSRGIGRAMAELLADAGANVAISSRKQDACDEVASAINGRHGPGRAIAVAASISDKQALARLVATTRAEFGKIDVLVCNAASNPYYGPSSGITDEQFRKIFENNVLSTHQLITMVVPEMIERRDGSIIIISSVGGLLASPTIGAYNVSKAADFQIVRNLAWEYGPSNVRINAIAPGIIRTDFARALWDSPDATEKLSRHTPLGRAGEPEEIAGAALFLASRAGSYVNGSTMVIDGGLSIGLVP